MWFHKAERTLRSNHRVYKTVTGLSILVGLLLAGCAQYDGEVGGDILSGGFQGTIREISVPVERDSTRLMGDAFKLQTVSLPLGKQDGLESQIFLRYINYVGLGDSLHSVSEARIVLHANSFLDSARIADFTPWRAEVNRIDSPVDPLQLKYGDDLELTAIDTLLFGTAESLDSIEIQLAEETLFRWVNDTLNYGLLIRPLEEASFIKLFFARPADPLQAPLLRVTGTFERDGTVYPDSLVNIQVGNAFFLTDDERLDDVPEKLVISTGYVRNSLFYSNLSQLLSPSRASVNRSLLVLTMDSTWDRALGAPTSYTWRYLVSDWFSSPLDSVTFGTEIPTSAYGTYEVNDSTGIIQIDVTPIVRGWVAVPEDNFGLLVQSINEGSLMRRVAFYSSEASDESLRPYLRITYTEYDEP